MQTANKNQLINSSTSSCSTPIKCPIRFSASNENANDENVDIAWSEELPKSGQDAFNHIMQSLTGTVNSDLAIDMHTRASSAMPGSMYGALQQNKTLAAQTLSELRPQDATEAMLCYQLITLHSQAMEHLRRAEATDLLHFQDSSLNSASKLLKLHHASLEALMKYRRKGEQKVTVQHQHQYVQVNEGGQAIVGSQLTPGESEKTKEAPYEQTMWRQS